MKLSGVLLSTLLCSTSWAGPTFDYVYKSLDKGEYSSPPLDTSVQNPLYNKLQLIVKNQQEDSVDFSDSAGVALKLSPFAWGQLTKEKKLNQEYSRLAKIINKEGSAKECLYTGLLFANAFYIQKALKIHQRLAKYYDSNTKLLKLGIKQNLYEFNEILSTQESLVSNKMYLDDLENLALHIQDTMNKRLKTPIKVKDLDFRNFISIKRIKSKAGDIQPRALELEKLRTLVNIKDLEHDIEQRTSNQIVDSIQVFRRERPGEDIGYGLQVTFNIPVFNKRGQIREAMQRQLAINSLAKLEQESLVDTEGTNGNFRNKIKKYEQLMVSDYYKTLIGLRRVLASSKSNSPFMIIQTKIKIAKEKLKAIELRNHITTEYLAKLYHGGQLAACEGPSHLVGK